MNHPYGQPREPAYDAALKSWKVELNDGNFAIFDECDLEAVQEFKWYSTGRGRPYAIGYKKGNRTGGMKPMHRVFLKPPRRSHVDHINGNGLDNRRANIRLATRSQNMMNKRPKGNIKYKGVFWVESVRRKERGGRRQLVRKWQVEAGPAGKKEYLGRFVDPVEAAKVYDARAKELYGDFAKLNFPS